MYDRFQWSRASARRNRLTMEYEPLQPFFLMALARKAACETFLDVGANIGVYCLFATQMPSVSRVVAFEPDPETLGELSSNIARNGLSERIEVHGKVVSSNPGTVTFGVIGKLSGANSVVDTSIHDRSNFHGEINVEAIMLDELFFEPSTAPICIKVDVEGHEGKVIDGAKAMLRANGIVIQIERIDGENDTGRMLASLGYSKLTSIGPDHYYSNLPGLADPASVVAAYEQASADLIAFYHRIKTVSIGHGDFTLQLAGKSAAAARKLKARFAGNS